MKSNADVSTNGFWLSRFGDAEYSRIDCNCTGDGDGCNTANPLLLLLFSVKSWNVFSCVSWNGAPENDGAWENAGEGFCC